MYEQEHVDVDALIVSDIATTSGPAHAISHYYR